MPRRSVAAPHRALPEFPSSKLACVHPRFERAALIATWRAPGNGATMPDDRRRQLVALCDEALARGAEERAAYLDEACAGDAGLRREVESLLAAASRLNGFLETPAWTPGDAPLPPGTRLGPYEIEALVGEGGMARVYRAHDTRLGRAVAIKVLLPGVAADPDRRRRFEHEARAASALNHPHICTVYDVGVHSAMDSDQEVDYLVMEYLEGETLAARLRRQNVPLAQALEIGIQVADALSAAHRHGIIHRDLKPGNVMLTDPAVTGARSPHAKLLDFGLAKLKPPQRRARSGSASTDNLESVTAPGVVLGTLPYMAPEQVEEKEADARTDLWALGALLYEMLTRTRPFTGTSPVSLAGAILEREPPPLSTIAPATPPLLQRLVQRCLAKNPDERWDSAHDVADELRGIKDGLLPRPRGLPAIAAALFIVAGITAAVAMLWLSWRPTPEANPSLPYTSIVPLVTESSLETDPRISPDGRWLSFLSDRDGPMRLFVEAVNPTRAAPSLGDAPRRVEVPGQALVAHAWSPDGYDFACVVREADGMALKILPFSFSSGLPRLTVPLKPTPEAVRVSRWIGDAVYLDVELGPAGHPLWRVDLAQARVDDVTATWRTNPKVGTFERTADGRRLAVAASDTRLKARAFDLSANGARVVFSASDGKQIDLWTARLDGSDLQRRTNDAWIENTPVWVGSTDRVAFQSNRSGHLDLWELDMATDRLQQVTTSQSGAVPGDATDDGSALFFEQMAESAALWLGDAAGRPWQITADALSDTSPSVSRDGGHVAFQRTLPVLREGFDPVDTRVFVASLSTDGKMSEPSLLDEGFAPRVSADGSWVAYFKRAPDGRRCQVVARNLRTGDIRTATGTASIPAFPNRPPYDAIQQQFNWSPDGAHLYFVNAPGKERHIERLDVTADGPPKPLVESSSDWFQDVYPSRDGQRLAYLSRSGDYWGPSGVIQLHVRDLRSGKEDVRWEGRGRPASAFLRGWTSNEGLLLVRSRMDADMTNTLELIEITAEKKIRPVTTIGGAHLATARLDPAGNRLYVTRVEKGIRNIYAVLLADGRVTRVTTNEHRRISFSGIEPLSNGGLCYSRSELKRDIALARRSGR